MHEIFFRCRLSKITLIFSAEIRLCSVSYNRVLRAGLAQLTVVDVLKRASAAVLHADPELVSPEVAAKVGHNVGVPAVLHHQDLLLDDPKLVPWEDDVRSTPSFIAGSGTQRKPLTNCINARLQKSSLLLER